MFLLEGENPIAFEFGEAEVKVTVSINSFLVYRQNLCVCSMLAISGQLVILLDGKNPINFENSETQVLVTVAMNSNNFCSVNHIYYACILSVGTSIGGSRTLLILLFDVSENKVKVTVAIAFWFLDNKFGCISCVFVIFGQLMLP